MGKGHSIPQPPQFFASLVVSVQPALQHVSVPAQPGPLRHVVLQAHDSQSPGTSHCFPAPHGPQLPPQSTSVSSPFFTPSLHVGAWQPPTVHTPLAQSPPTSQGAPVAHCREVAAQLPLTHTQLKQSLVTVQGAPVEPGPASY
jgi:hypothetical protein